MSECWRIGRLGTARLVTAHGGSLPLVRKDAVLLVYVGMNPGVGGSRVATLLWPDATERGALNNLRQRLHRLRKVTGARLLEVAETATPAHDFSLLPMPDRESLEADPDAWNGELLEGIAFDDADELSAWLAAERKAWTDRRRDALAALASMCERAGELVRGLRYAQRLLVDDPLSEHVHRRLMRLHYLRGDRAAAVAAFEACERALKDELGLRPSAETLELLQTIECSAAPARVATGPMPTTLLRPPRSVGRSAERAQLARAHADGRVAALVGEAGMGKTRLLQDFIAAQPRAVYAQARPGDAAVPYGALARLLRAVLAAVPEAVDAAPRSELARVAPELAEGATAATPGQAPRLQAAIEHLLAHALGRGVNTLVVDDLHFADPASVEMLRALVDADALADVHWAFAHRPIGPNDPNGALLQALADSPRACWIALAPLTDADLVELMEGLALPNVDPAAFAPALARHTGGNPLYVLETLREVHGLPPDSPSAAGFVLPRPQSIAHMIDRRLQRLSERALALARVAALAGADFSAELAEHALATPVLLLAGAWAELEAADVLRGTAFAHDLVRDGMLRATPPPIAGHAHRSLAEFLARTGGEPARVAQHWHDGGDPARAASAWVVAADRAKGASRLAEELELLERAAAALSQAGDVARFIEVLARIGPLCLTMGNIASARRAAERALDSARIDSERVQGLILSMEVHGFALEFPESLVAAERLILCAQACGDAGAELRGWRGVAAAHGNEGRIEQALAVHETHAAWVNAQPLQEDVLEWSIDHAYMLDRLGRQDESTILYAQVARRALDHGHARVAYDALTNQVMSTYRLGLTAQALSLATRIRPLAEDDGCAPQIDAIHQSVVGALHRDLGHFATAIEMLEAAIVASRAQNADHWVPGMLCTLAVTYAQLGQHHRVGQLLAQLPPPIDPPAHAYNVMSRSHAARYDAASRSGSAAVHLKALTAALSEDLPDRFRMWLLLELAAWPGSDGAIDAAEQGLALAQRVGGPGFVLHARVRRMDGLRQSGDLSQALSAARSVAEELAARDAHGIYRPQALLLCAASLRADPPAAAKLISEARSWIEQAAAKHVPAPFRLSFLERNAAHAATRDS